MLLQYLILARRGHRRAYLMLLLSHYKTNKVQQTYQEEDSFTREQMNGLISDLRVGRRYDSAAV